MYLNESILFEIKLNRVLVEPVNAFHIAYKTLLFTSSNCIRQSASSRSQVLIFLIRLKIKLKRDFLFLHDFSISHVKDHLCSPHLSARPSVPTLTSSEINMLTRHNQKRIIIVNLSTYIFMIAFYLK